VVEERRIRKHEATYLGGFFVLKNHLLSNQIIDIIVSEIKKQRKENYMNEYVKVPVHRLREVEKARVALYKLLEKDGFFERHPFSTMAITEITEPIWYIANRKWEKA